MPDLKLLALDAQDLAVISTNLQDAVVRIGDMTYQKTNKRFAAVLNRFDWIDAEKRGAIDLATSYERRRTGLRFEQVLGAQVANLDLNASDSVLSLLAISFETTQSPQGDVTLHFAGGGAIKLTVACIECELRDLGAAWATKNKPAHDDLTDDDTAQ